MQLLFSTFIRFKLVTSIPKSFVKKLLNMMKRKGKKKILKRESIAGKEEIIEEEEEEVERKDEAQEVDEAKEYIDKSKVLWMRGATRLHSQLQVVETFQSKLEEIKDQRDTLGSVHSLREKPSDELVHKF